MERFMKMTIGSSVLGVAIMGHIRYMMYHGQFILGIHQIILGMLFYRQREYLGEQLTTKITSVLFILAGVTFLYMFVLPIWIEFVV